ncbi:FAD-dependent oxidoreductase [Streptomyces albireticuli]|uniref:FAD-dependent oxidoreductase n=1 Tax=Streptomyces albireticuli TaxID=1940 RepID=A0A1Z2L1Y8_9ACTN|nr:FAD-dependent oxidoreductase [Streptomyces albireticuli]ARZ68294.1 FAD-dependent oxidoreductase [Streptomyces albireticuli]
MTTPDRATGGVAAGGAPSDGRDAGTGAAASDGRHAGVTPEAATAGVTTARVTAADVAVIGGGIIGLATAERLSAHGLSVVVIDERGPAGGVTGASGGLVRALDLSSAAHSWAAEGLDRYLRRGDHGRWPAVREDGSLTLFGADDTARAVEGVERVRATGHGAEILDAGEISRAFPGLAVPEGFTGVYEPRAGWLPARETAEAMLRDADSVTFLGGVRALEIVTAGSRVTGVRTTAGLVTTPAVLLAAGVHSTELARTAGVELPLRTRSVSFCVFAPRGRETGGAGAPGPLPAVLDSTTGGWLRRWDDGTAVLAGVPSPARDVPPAVTRGVPAAEEERVRAVARHRYPGLADADLVGGVTAYDALAPGDMGTVTAWPDPYGLVTATGWNGGGFKQAPAAGRYAAGLLREVLA